MQRMEVCYAAIIRTIHCTGRFVADPLTTFTTCSRWAMESGKFSHPDTFENYSVYRLILEYLIMPDLKEKRQNVARTSYWIGAGSGQRYQPVAAATRRLSRVTLALAVARVTKRSRVAINVPCRGYLILKI